MLSRNLIGASLVIAVFAVIPGAHAECAYTCAGLGQAISEPAIITQPAVVVEQPIIAVRTPGVVLPLPPVTLLPPFWLRHPRLLRFCIGSW